MGPQGNSAKKLSRDNEETHEKDTKVAGRPVFVSGLNRRIVENEDDIIPLYRNGVFCPSFRWNTAAQKRFFDVLLSGCTPVVLECEKSHET
jgi:hypothetical protein